MLPSPTQLPPWLDWGIATRPMPEQSECGDAWLVVSQADGVLTAVVDGLGHGPLAATAARRAVDSIRSAASAPLPAILRSCHQALIGTRGAAVSLARIGRRTRSLEWVGVGNVEGLVLDLAGDAAGRRVSLMVRSGVVGHKIPALTSSSVPFQPGACLSLATDGIGYGFGAELRAGEGAQRMADRILSQHGRQSDDALILVVQWRGGSELDRAS